MILLAQSSTLPSVHWWFSFNRQRWVPWTPILGLSKNGAGVLGCPANLYVGTYSFSILFQAILRNAEPLKWFLHQPKMVTLGCEGRFCVPATSESFRSAPVEISLVQSTIWSWRRSEGRCMDTGDQQWMCKWMCLKIVYLNPIVVNDHYPY